MKKSILSVLFFFFLSAVIAQTALITTKIEDAINTKNSLFKEEIFSIDKLAYFRIDPVKITNLENFSITSGLKTIHQFAVGKEQKTIYNYIDFEEIDQIITSLHYMKTIIKSKTTPNNYSEIKYCSKSGFLVKLQTFLNENKKLDWRFSVLTNSNNEKTLIQLTVDDIEKLQKAFEQAKVKL